MNEAAPRIDRLFPDTAAELTLDEAMAGFALPSPADRPLVAVNMVTSIDGRAQLDGSAEGLGSRTDRLLMRHYRAAFDAVGSGAGTMRAGSFWLRVGDELGARRASRGRPPQPTGVIIGGSEPVPTEGRWYEGDEPRLLVVGRDNPVREAPPGTELLRAPADRPSPRWLLGELAARDIRTFLLEGGPNLNAAFLAEDLIDELYWTVGAHLLGTEALPMVAPIDGGSPYRREPRRGRLLSVHRHEDELFLRYRFGPDTGTG